MWTETEKRDVGPVYCRYLALGTCSIPLYACIERLTNGKRDPSRVPRNLHMWKIHIHRWHFRHVKRDKEGGACVSKETKKEVHVWAKDLFEDVHTWRGDPIYVESALYMRKETKKRDQEARTCVSKRPIWRRAYVRRRPVYVENALFQGWLRLVGSLKL